MSVTATILELITEVMSSPWLYAIIFALAVLDAFIIVVPSESAIITAGVFAATGAPEPLLLMVVAAAGAMIGDHASYGLGRRYGSRLIDRLPESGRKRKAFTWAQKALLERGGMALVVARYIPGGRSAVTLTTGAIRYPIKSFVIYDAFAAVSWAVYCTLVGYVGGAAFEENPLYGVLLGLSLALGLAALVEVVRARRTTSQTSDSESDRSFSTTA
jgi:membrane-associated protein